MVETAGQATLRQAKNTGPFGYIFIPFTDRQIITTLEIAILRNQYEKEIQESQKWLTAVLNGIADGVVAIDDQGQIRYINKVALNLIGCQRGETIGRYIHEILRLTDEKTSEQIDLLRTNNSADGTENDLAFDSILTTQANETIPIEVKVTSVTESNVPGRDRVIAFRNIQRQRETLNEIQHQAERAQTLVKSAEQLNSNLELSNVLGTICQLTNNAIKASGTAVFLLDKKKDIFHDVSATTESANFKNTRKINIRFQQILSTHLFRSRIQS
ncbi:MAG: PAS domain S-box protein [Anaerolineales bacterium]